MRLTNKRGGERKKDKVYRSHYICYRKGVKKPVLVIAEWFYHRPKRRWRVVFSLCTKTYMPPERVIEEYTLRREIETTHSDSKRCMGFEDCRLHTEKSIEAWCCLSLLSTGILEFLRWRLMHSPDWKHSTGGVMETLRMHWYHPRNLTRSLVCCYLRHFLLAWHHDPATSGADFFTTNPFETLTA